MYNQKLVASLKANGKILREFKDTVYVPFGSEYSILLKNLNTVRAIVNITIDGEDMVPGGLVLNAGQEIDLERSIKNNNLSEGNRFKFIERTGAVEQHRGVKLEDGLIRIEYQFEKVYVGPATTIWGPNNTWAPFYASNSLTRGKMLGQVTHDSYTLNDVQCSTASAKAESYNEVGITVPGSKSEQKFTTVNNFAVETEKHVIVLKMLGETPDNKPVVQAVTVKHKPKCTTCGKLNKVHAKFCSECGTALEIFA